MSYRAHALALLASLSLAGICPAQESAPAARPYGLKSRTVPKPYLGMPDTATGRMPALLSQTGVFKDTAHLIPSDGLIPYELQVAFWSDGANKLRWISIPKGKIGFSPTGEWTFPAGTVLVKTFELPVDDTNPAVQRRLETRLLVRDSKGGVYGVLYKWKPDDSDAELLSSSLTEDIPIKTASGGTRTQTWYYPSRKNCLECHNAHTSGVLGVKTRQMNHEFTYPSGVTDNELRTWNHLGLFEPSFKDADIAGFAQLAAETDTSRSLEDRARSYLDANCSQCHRPGGTVANFDARYDTPLDKQGLVNGPVLIDERIDHSRVIAPNDIWRSIAYMRVNTNGEIRMPPLARETIDEKGVALLRQWINSLPGRPVVAPPGISPAGGNFKSPVEVTLNVAEPGADIRYTLDGSTPTASDQHYDKPINITGPTVVRARAFKDGYTRSIASQAVFIVSE
ncbi:MAG TPA: chitobiase/beta-hexosaminidase C-terminal domain-containing protein [Steroidobacteraceae bacterium]|nr:chitobiase/beta-hexosaminidase C-terminal domain-containing protein [Steroidobacteraceae bacterium]